MSLEATFIAVHIYRKKNNPTRQLKKKPNTVQKTNSDKQPHKTVMNGQILFMERGY